MAPKRRQKASSFTSHWVRILTRPEEYNPRLTSYLLVASHLKISQNLLFHACVLRSGPTLTQSHTDRNACCDARSRVNLLARNRRRTRFKKRITFLHKCDGTYPIRTCELVVQLPQDAHRGACPHRACRCHSTAIDDEAGCNQRPGRCDHTTSLLALDALSTTVRPISRHISHMWTRLPSASVKSGRGGRYLLGKEAELGGG